MNCSLCLHAELLELTAALVLIRVLAAIATCCFVSLNSHNHHILNFLSHSSNGGPGTLQRCVDIQYTVIEEFLNPIDQNLDFFCPTHTRTHPYPISWYAGSLRSVISKLWLAASLQGWLGVRRERRGRDGRFWLGVLRRRPWTMSWTPGPDEEQGYQRWSPDTREQPATPSLRSSIKNNPVQSIIHSCNSCIPVIVKSKHTSESMIFPSNEQG